MRLVANGKSSKVMIIVNRTIYTLSNATISEDGSYHDDSFVQAANAPAGDFYAYYLYARYPVCVMMASDIRRCAS